MILHKTIYLSSILMVSVLIFSCGEEKFAGRTRAEWQDYANRTGLPVSGAVPGETIYPEEKSSDNSEQELTDDASVISEENNAEYTNSDTENNNTEEQIDDVTNSVIGDILSAKRECTCCGSNFSPSSGYSEDGKSPTLNGSERCSSGQTVFCSANCYQNFEGSNCN